MVPDLELFAQRGLVLPDRFVHFSSTAGIEGIVASGELRPSSTIVDSVFAVAVGARSVPGVQHARGGDGRRAAVLFSAAVLPAQWFPEEVIWRGSSPLPITPLEVLTVDAADALLDGSLGVPDAGWWHRDACVCDQCSHRRSVLAGVV